MRTLAVALALAAVLVWQFGLVTATHVLPGGVSIVQAIDSNGDLHSNDHTGSKGNGGGGNGTH